MNGRYKTNTMVTTVLVDGEIRGERLMDGDTLDNYVAHTAMHYGARLLRIAFTSVEIDTRTGAVVEIHTSHYTAAEVNEMKQSHSERRAAERKARLAAWNARVEQI